MPRRYAEALRGLSFGTGGNGGFGPFVRAGKPDFDACASSGKRRDAEGARIGADDTADSGQTQSPSHEMAGIEGIEGAFENFGTHPAAAVFDNNSEAISLGVAFIEMQFAGSGIGFAGFDGARSESDTDFAREAAVRLRGIRDEAPQQGFEGAAVAGKDFRPGGYGDTHVFGERPEGKHMVEDQRGVKPFDIGRTITGSREHEAD